MIEGYRELINSINLHKHLKEVAESEYTYNQELFQKNKYMNTRRTIDSKPLDRIMEDLHKYENMVHAEDERIKYLEDKKKAIDECIDQSDITIKVAQLRALGLKQETVAELVDRHVNTVKNIEKRMKNCT